MRLKNFESAPPDVRYVVQKCTCRPRVHMHAHLVHQYFRPQKYRFVSVRAKHKNEKLLYAVPIHAALKRYTVGIDTGYLYVISKTAINRGDGVRSV